MGTLLNITKEYFKKEMRAEDGVRVTIGGKEYFMLFEDFPELKETEMIGGSVFIDKKFDFLENPVKVCMFHTKNNYGDQYVYKYLKDIKFSDKIIKECEFEYVANSNYNMVDDDFLPLKILYKTFENTDKIKLSEDDYGEIDFTGTLYVEDCEKRQYLRTKCFEIDGNDFSVSVYKNRAAAINAATDTILNNLEDNYNEGMDDDSVKLYIEAHGDEWIDKNEVCDKLLEKIRDKYEELEYEDGKHGNKLIDLMLEKGLLEDNSDSFDVDFDKPKFEKDEYMEKLIKEVEDYEEVSYEKAKKIVDSYDESEYIEQLMFFDIVDDTDKYFELDYKNPSPEKMKGGLDKLVSDEYSEEDDKIKMYIDRYGELPEDCYNLSELADLVIDTENLGGYFNEDDPNEQTCEIDGNEYFVYIKST